MRKINVFVTIAILLTSYISLAQQSMKGGMVYCPYYYDNTDFSQIPSSEKVRRNLSDVGRAFGGANANIVVTYNGFT